MRLAMMMMMMIFHEVFDTFLSRVNTTRRGRRKSTRGDDPNHVHSPRRFFWNNGVVVLDLVLIHRISSKLLCDQVCRRIKWFNALFFPRLDNFNTIWLF